MNSKKTRIIVISLLAIVISIVVFLTAYFKSQQKQNDALLDPFIAATKGVAGNHKFFFCPIKETQGLST